MSQYPPPQNPPPPMHAAAGLWTIRRSAARAQAEQRPGDHFADHGNSQLHSRRGPLGNTFQRQLGLGKAKDPRYGGKGLAITGIVLGLLSIVVYLGIGYTVYWGVGKFKAMAEPGVKFFQAIDKGDLTLAKTYTTGNISDAELAPAQNDQRHQH